MEFRDRCCTGFSAYERATGQDENQGNNNLHLSNYTQTNVPKKVQNQIKLLKKHLCEI